MDCVLTPFPIVFAPLRPLIAPFSVFFPILEIPFVKRAVRPHLFPRTVGLVPGKISRVHRSVSVSVDTFAIKLVIHELALIPVAVWEPHLTLSIGFALSNSSYVAALIWQDQFLAS